MVFCHSNRKSNYNIPSSWFLSLMLVQFIEQVLGQPRIAKAIQRNPVLGGENTKNNPKTK